MHFSVVYHKFYEHTSTIKINNVNCKNKNRPHDDTNYLLVKINAL
jgi:hypothetical protein